MRLCKNKFLNILLNILLIVVLPAALMLLFCFYFEYFFWLIVAGPCFLTFLIEGLKNGGKV